MNQRTNINIYIYQLNTLLLYTSIYLVLGLIDSNNIRQRLLDTILASRIMWHHDVDTNSKDSLTHENVAGSRDDVFYNRVTSLDHVSLLELHGLGSLSSQLSRDDDFASLGTSSHDDTDDSIGSTSHSKTSEELELERLSLSLSTKSLVGNSLSVELNGALGEVESLLDDTIVGKDTRDIQKGGEIVRTQRSGMVVGYISIAVPGELSDSPSLLS